MGADIATGVAAAAVYFILNMNHRLNIPLCLKLEILLSSVIIFPEFRKQFIKILFFGMRQVPCINQVQILEG